jgi:hypothetical protein
MTIGICKVKPTQKHIKAIEFPVCRKSKLYLAVRENTMHAPTTFSQHSASVGLETTLSMTMSRQGMFTDKHVMIYKIYEKP